ncbi:MAG: hypothetical protein KBC33_03535 [Candidatus Pacebacteria bacterium]|nr:hypothetical protein [Candidatus Paceibacterota bacterium]
MPPPENQNRIEDLKKSLYSRNAPDVRTRRKLRFSPTETTVQTAWERPPEEESVAPTKLNESYKDTSMSFLTKLLIASIVFCVIAVGIGAYLFFNGSNLISADNIAIDVRGPVSIPGGAPVSFDITVVNNNNVDLQGAYLAVDFPAGTTDADDRVSELKLLQEPLDDIPAGGSVTKTVRAIMFGQENLQRQIGMKVTYKVKGSTALFTKTSSYDVLINSSPVLLTVSSFDEITSGQELAIKLSVKSNSQDILKNVLLKASYPFGWVFTSSDIKPLADNSTWKIGDIPPGGERTITIRGTVQGEDSESRVFRFVAGAQSAVDTKVIGTQYMTAEHALTIQKPFISLGIAVNNDDTASDYIGQFGQSQRMSVNWFNNLSTSVSNMVITAKLSGSAYDKSAVQPDQGYFNSATNEIVWNRQTNSDFGSIGAGENGQVTFTIAPRDLSAAGKPVVNPTVVVSASVAGSRTQGSSVPEKLSSVVERTTRIPSNVALSGRVVRSVGPFQNTGPIPPKVEQATTYTILWTVDNTSSAVTNAQVTATLPAYVKWLGAVSPSSESITYDENSGLVTWNIGNVGTYTTDSSRRREVYFQVSFQPGVNLANQSPTLLNQATLSAIDSFTGTQLQNKQDYLTTRFSTDPEYKEGQATVAK